MNIKNQTWCGHDIRFVEKDGDWWAILKDVCDALDLKAYNVANQLREYQDRRNKDDKTTQIGGIGTTNTSCSDDKTTQIGDHSTRGVSYLSTVKLKDRNNHTQEMLVVSEKGIYRLITQSRKEEAEDFQDWLYDILVELRKASGLEDWEAFRMTDKGIQKDLTARLYKFNHPETREEVIKANTIANYVVAQHFGLPKTIGKGEMTREMLEYRQPVYDDTINLMIAQKAFNLDISISKKVYAKYLGRDE